MGHGRLIFMPSTNKDQDQFYYEGFSSPNGTIVPDDVFDKLLPHLSDIELRVLLYLIRRTFGFKKESDDIILRQIVQGIQTRDGRVLDRGAGVSKPSAIKAARLLEQKGIIVKQSNRSREKGDEATTYGLRFTGDPVSTELTRGGKLGLLGGVNGVDPQQTVEQQTESSNDRSFNLRQRTALQFSKRKVENLENVPDPDRTRTVRPGGTVGLQPIGALISHRRAQELARVGGDAATVETVSPTRSTTRGRPPTATPYIEQLLTEFSSELHDEEHTRQNIGQAARLRKASGRSESDFCALLYEARSITKQYTVKKRAQGEAGEYGLRNKMPYFFKVLRDLLGMKEQAAAVPRGTSPG